MKITHEQYQAAYECGRAVYAATLHVSDAIRYLSELGLNEASASFFVNNLKQMLNGELYQRAMSVASTDDFLTWIHRDYGAAALSNAIAALEKHIPYYKQTHSNPMAGHVSLVEKYRKILEECPADTSALLDISDRPLGNQAPDRAEKKGFFIIRDAKVRNFVIKRANGRCEYCGELGFAVPSGGHYIEAHHIIALSRAGYDTLENVIALCPNHHREAHFGARAEELENFCFKRLAEIEKANG